MELSLEGNGHSGDSKQILNYSFPSITLDSKTSWGLMKDPQGPSLHPQEEARAHTDYLIMTVSVEQTILPDLHCFVSSLLEVQFLWHMLVGLLANPQKTILNI